MSGATPSGREGRYRLRACASDTSPHRGRISNCSAPGESEHESRRRVNHTHRRVAQRSAARVDECLRIASVTIGPYQREIIAGAHRARPAARAPAGDRDPRRRSIHPPGGPESGVIERSSGARAAMSHSLPSRTGPSRAAAGAPRAAAAACHSLTMSLATVGSDRPQADDIAVACPFKHVEVGVGPLARRRRASRARRVAARSHVRSAPPLPARHREPALRALARSGRRVASPPQRPLRIPGALEPSSYGV